MDGYRVEYIEELYIAEGVEPDEAHARAVVFCRRMRTYDRDRRSYDEYIRDARNEVLWYLQPAKARRRVIGLAGKRRQYAGVDVSRERQDERRKMRNKLKKSNPER